MLSCLEKYRLFPRFNVQETLPATEVEKNNNTIRAALLSEYPYDGIQALYKVAISQYDNIVIPSGYEANYLMIQMYGNFTDEPDFSGIMLNSGATALPWEPYTGGAPSPSTDYPQEIKSVGDSGTINVTLSDGGSQSQTLPIQTPNGLPGIPVASGGNYTDASGQQWVCDEVDFERGVYVQRVNKKILTSALPWKFALTTGNGNNNFQIRLTSEEGATGVSSGKPVNSMCNFLKYAGLAWDDNEINLPKIYASSLEITASFPPDSEVNSLQKWNELLDGIGNCYIYYILYNPIETPLSAEQISAYKALHTYSPTTTVSNDAGAWMKVGYREWRR